MGVKFAISRGILDSDLYRLHDTNSGTSYDEIGGRRKGGKRGKVARVELVRGEF